MTNPSEPYGYPTKPENKTRRFAFKCHYKPCGHRWTADFVLTCIGWTFDTRYGYHKPKWDFVGAGPSYGHCPKCESNRISGQTIQGRKNDTPCDHRCTSAKGHLCECSCGGENHGKDHLITVSINQ